MPWVLLPGASGYSEPSPGVFLVCGILTGWSGRLAPLTFAIPSAVGLATIDWCRLRVWPLAMIFVALAAVSGFGPVDLEFRSSGGPRIEVLPYSYGLRCVPGTVCRGCSEPRHPADYAVVVSLPLSPDPRRLRGPL